MKGLRTIRLACLSVCLFLLVSCGGKATMPETMVASSDAGEWVASLKGKSLAEQSILAAKVWADPNEAPSIRDRATYILATRENSQTNIAQSSLLKQYSVATLSRKVVMENTLYIELSRLNNAGLKTILKRVSPQMEGHYPYSLIVYVAAKRNIFPNSEFVAKRLVKSGFFHSPQIVGHEEMAYAKAIPRKGCVAMLLPQNGDLAPISQRIVVGAEVAREVLLTEGLEWDVHYIDTDDALWIQKLKNLPEICVTVGGPLQQSIYRQLEENEFLSKRVFFPFLPRLTNPKHEGKTVWRFFSSPEDQINAMLNVVSTDFDIKSFGVFSPQSSYGESMQDAFVKIAEERGFEVAVGTYPVDEVRAWSFEIQRFLKSSPPEGNQKLPTLETSFDAVFLPDSWRNIDMIVSTMRYHGGHKKMILGTSLWEQSLSNPLMLNDSIFKLTMFPVAYDSMRSSHYSLIFNDAMEKKMQTPNDWVVLGFDFVLMASKLGFDVRLPSTLVNEHLVALSVPYVGAPFVWNDAGKLTRMLTVNQPSSEKGRVPYEKDAVLSHYLYEEIVPEIPEETPEEKAQREQKALDDLINRINPPSRKITQ